MPDFGFDGVSSSLAEFMSIFFFFNFFFCIMYVTQTPQTTDSTRAVQGASYNQLATTLYKPRQTRLPRASRRRNNTTCVG